MIKQAIIPLAGLGTRLLPLTSVFAKELLPINGRPGIEYILDECIEAGIKEIVFIISSKKLMIKKYFYSDQFYKNIIQKQLRPEARNDIIEFFQESKIKPTSMIDISDGLSSEIIHLCKSSNKGCKIYEDKIPISDDSLQACEEFNLEPTTIALSGGEDYQLLFTVGQENLEKIQNNLNLSVIGHITLSKEMILIEKSGRNIMIESLGWKSF